MCHSYSANPIVPYTPNLTAARATSSSASYNAL